MFEFTFVQKLMLLGLGSVYLWYFMWVWKNGHSGHNSSPGRFTLNLKRFGGSRFNKK